MAAATGRGAEGSDQHRAVVGVSAFGHDAAAALVRAGSGETIAAIAEERLSGRKHDSQFPIGALRTCLAIADARGLQIADVAIAHDPEAFITEALPRQLHRLGATSAFDTSAVLQHFRAVAAEMDGCGNLDELPPWPAPAHVADERSTRETIRWYYEWALFHQHVALVAGRLCGLRPRVVPHHLSHAAAAFFNSGATRATVITIDGQGEADASGVFLGANDQLTRVATSWWPFSLGAVYLAVTAHLGFELGDEGKVMGMAAYGKPIYASDLLGAISVSDLAELSIASGDTLTIATSDRLPHSTVALGDRLTGPIPRRVPGAEFDSRHFDLAASMQAALETIAVDLVRKAIALTGCPTVALAGGVCLNARMNQAIRRHSGCSDLFVFPASGDDGTAVGAAQIVARRVAGSTPRFDCFLGQADATTLTACLDRRGVRYSRLSAPAVKLAEALASGQIVARFAGRAEFGPRALGHRSILADPRDPATRDVLNQRIKQREMFRPFAPICALEDAPRYFETAHPLPHMTEIIDVPLAARTAIAAAVHIDGTARLQTITPDSDPELHSLLKAFAQRTGVPVLINTSFNVSGEPLVDSVDDALDTFLYMHVDYLWIDDVIVARRDNGHLPSAVSLPALLEARRARNHAVLQPPVNLDLSTEDAIRRFWK